MKCVVPGANVKILAKAIHALAKIGDEMYIEPQKEAISFRTINMANSAYADFTFLQNYFSYYSYGDLQENDALKCKISMRSVLTVFKASNVIDKQVETCHIRLEPDASEILFILKHKNSITKTHLLPILDCEILQTSYDKDCASNQLSCQSRVLGDAIQNFHQHLVEITLEISPQKLLLRNYIDDTSGLSNTTRTQLALGKGEFDKYNIANGTSITFCLKEFKAVLTFAEIVCIPLSLYFEGPGRPVIFALRYPSFEGNLVLSTLSSDVDSQTETTVVGRQEKSIKRRTGNKKGGRRPSTSTSKTESRSIKLKKTLTNSTSINTNPLDEKKETKQDLFKEQMRTALPNVSSGDIQNNINENNDYNLRLEQNTKDQSYNHSSSSSDMISRFGKASTSRKELVNSIFSTTTTKRKIISDEIDNQQTKKIEQLDNQQAQKIEELDNVEDSVPNSPSPPVKKARLLFQRCFQKTFDPRTLPGYDVILAEDSDEYCSE